jgi:7-keto-8-aminopelargonate synthetase-like enzyme
MKILLVPALGGKSPESTVPISRDKKFVGRQDILRALESQLSQFNHHNRAVLAGLGGVGYK